MQAAFDCETPKGGQTMSDAALQSHRENGDWTALAELLQGAVLVLRTPTSSTGEYKDGASHDRCQPEYADQAVGLLADQVSNELTLFTEAASFALMRRLQHAIRRRELNRQYQIIDEIQSRFSPSLALRARRLRLLDFEEY